MRWRSTRIVRSTRERCEVDPGHAGFDGFAAGAAHDLGANESRISLTLRTRRLVDEWKCGEVSRQADTRGEDTSASAPRRGATRFRRSIPGAGARLGWGAWVGLSGRGWLRRGRVRHAASSSRRAAACSYCSARTASSSCLRKRGDAAARSAASPRIAAARGSGCRAEAECATRELADVVGSALMGAFKERFRAGLKAL